MVYNPIHKPWKKKFCEYNGTELCSYCHENVAKFIFKSGKLCCKGTASHCPHIRKRANEKINAVDSDGISKAIKRAKKAAETKRNTIDEDGKSIFDKYGEKMKKWLETTIDENGRSHLSRISLSDDDYSRRSEWKKYSDKVESSTRQNFLKYKHLISNSEFRSTEYQLDHIYSIRQGFIDNINPEIIGHVTNLRIVHRTVNRAKSKLCDKTKKQLIEDYTTFLP